MVRWRSCASWWSNQWGNMLVICTLHVRWFKILDNPYPAYVHQWSEFTPRSIPHVNLPPIYMNPESYKIMLFSQWIRVLYLRLNHQIFSIHIEFGSWSNGFRKTSSISKNHRIWIRRKGLINVDPSSSQIIWPFPLVAQILLGQIQDSGPIKSDPSRSYKLGGTQTIECISKQSASFQMDIIKTIW